MAFVLYDVKRYMRRARAPRAEERREERRGAVEEQRAAEQRPRQERRAAARGQAAREEQRGTAAGAAGEAATVSGWVGIVYADPWRARVRYRVERGRGTLCVAAALAGPWGSGWRRRCWEVGPGEDEREVAVGELPDGEGASAEAWRAELRDLAGRVAARDVVSLTAGAEAAAGPIAVAGYTPPSLLYVTVRAPGTAEQVYELLVYLDGEEAARATVRGGYSGTRTVPVRGELAPGKTVRLVLRDQEGRVVAETEQILTEDMERRPVAQRGPEPQPARGQEQRPRLEILEYQAGAELRYDKRNGKWYVFPWARVRARSRGLAWIKITAYSSYWSQKLGKRTGKVIADVVLNNQEREITTAKIAWNIPEGATEKVEIWLTAVDEQGRKILEKKLGEKTITVPG